MMSRRSCRYFSCPISAFIRRQCVFMPVEKVAHLISHNLRFLAICKDAVRQQLQGTLYQLARPGVLDKPGGGPSIAGSSSTTKGSRVRVNAESIAILLSRGPEHRDHVLLTCELVKEVVNREMAGSLFICFNPGYFLFTSM
jgi:hypothetical protein